MKVRIEGIPDSMVDNKSTLSFAIHSEEIIKDELEARGISQKIGTINRHSSICINCSYKWQKSYQHRICTFI